MHTSFLKNALIAVAALSFVTSSQKLIAKQNTEQSSSSLVYERLNYPFITIKHNNAKGKAYKILNEEGKVIFKGVIKSSDAILLPTRNIGFGKFTFEVSGKKIQYFEIV